MAEESTRSAPNNDWQQRIDRLVDGELSAGEQQQLLAELESRPDQWRRCALAFVEAHVWSSELTGLPGSTDAAPRDFPPANRGGKWFASAGSLLLGAAAGALLTLGMSQFVPETGTPTPAPRWATSPGPAPADIDPSNVLTNDNESADPQPVGEATFFVSTGDQRQAMEMPVFAADDLTDDWRTNEPELPVEIVEALNRTGRRWTRSRELVPVTLDDGGQVIVPVNQISFESPVVYQ